MDPTTFASLVVTGISLAMKFWSLEEQMFVVFDMDFTSAQDVMRNWVGVLAYVLYYLRWLLNIELFVVYFLRYFRQLTAVPFITAVRLAFQRMILAYGQSKLWIFNGIILDWFAGEVMPDTLRKEFRQITIPKFLGGGTGHSHPLAAHDRTMVNIALDRLIENAGFIPYSISMAERDVGRGNDGIREMWFTKDLAMKFRKDKITSKHILKFVDTDYYVELRKYAKRGLPMVMYTFVPDRVAGSVNEGVFRLENGDGVAMTINGGATYHHQLWDYSADSVMFDYWWGSMLYKIESVKTNEQHRRIVGLFPARRIWGPIAWFVPGPRMERRAIWHIATTLKKNLLGYFFPSIRDIHVIRSLSSSEKVKSIDTVDGKEVITWTHPLPKLMVSAAANGWYHDIYLPSDVLHAILVRCKADTAGRIASIERILREYKVESPVSIATSIADIFDELALMPETKIQTNTCTVAPEKAYQTLYPLVTEDGVPAGRQVFPPLANAGVLPVRSFNNDNATLELRVREQTNTKIWPKVFYNYASEFARYIVPDSAMHTGVPLSYDEVSELQSRPTQLAGWKAASLTSFMHRNIVKAFQKVEVYAKFAAPRNISPANPDHRTRYGSFIYSIKNAHLKSRPWYAFSKKPVDIAERIHHIAKTATHMLNTDYSAWDGTHSEGLAQLDNMIGRRHFALQYHAEWDELFSSIYFARGITQHGVSYNTKWSRPSGFGDTSEFNSMENLFMLYVTLRESNMDHDATVKFLEEKAIVGGDDGAVADVPIATIKRITQRMGHVLKVEKRAPVEPLPFLGRVFLDPATSPRSVIDIARQVRKLHITSAPRDVPDEVAVLRKAVGLLVTDSTTPIVSQWAFMIVSLFGKFQDQFEKWEPLLANIDSWWAREKDPGSAFPLYGPHDPLSWSFAAEQLGTDISHCCTVSAAMLDAGRDVNLFPRDAFTDFLKVAVEIPVAVQGELLLPPGPSSTRTVNGNIQTLSTRNPFPAPRPENRALQHEPAPTSSQSRHGSQHQPRFVARPGAALQGQPSNDRNMGNPERWTSHTNVPVYRQATPLRPPSNQHGGQGPRLTHASGQNNQSRQTLEAYAQPVPTSAAAGRWPDSGPFRQLEQRSGLQMRPMPTVPRQQSRSSRPHSPNNGSRGGSPRVN